MSIHGPLISLKGVALDPIEQLQPAEDPPRVAGQLERGRAVALSVRGNLLLRRPGRSRPVRVPFTLVADLEPAS